MCAPRSLTCDEIAGMNWWNALPPVRRGYWLSVAGSASAADAWAAYKAVQLAAYRPGSCQ